LWIAIIQNSLKNRTEIYWPVMKAINVTSRHIPIGHTHARQYVIIPSRYPGSTNGGKRGYFEDLDVGGMRYTGKVIVVCCELIPIRHLSRCQKAKPPPSQTALPPATRTAGTHSNSNQLYDTQGGGAMGETILGIRIIRVHHRSRSLT